MSSISSSIQKPLNSIENEQLMLNFKRQFKQQAVINISVLFVIPILIFGIFQFIDTV